MSSSRWAIPAAQPPQRLRVLGRPRWTPLEVLSSPVLMDSACHLAQVRTCATRPARILRREAVSTGAIARPGRVAFRSLDRYGSSCSTAASSRRGPPGRGEKSRMLAVKHVGELGAGEPRCPV
jgi:hypothetical protein